jgi:hypothetical protein
VNSSREKVKPKSEALWQCGVPVFFAFTIERAAWVTFRDPKRLLTSMRQRKKGRYFGALP